VKNKVKIFLILIAAWAASSAIAAPAANIELYYAGHVFRVPANPAVIAATGGDDNILLLRYSSDKSKKYLAFSNMKSETNLDFGCATAQFFEALFTSRLDTSCHQEVLNSFKKTFIDGRDVGKWSSEKLTLYFSIHNEKSFLFAFDATGKSIKIDSDFLSKTELKNLVNGVQ
jgi:hypothetical protein